MRSTGNRALDSDTDNESYGKALLAASWIYRPAAIATGVVAAIMFILLALPD